MAHAYHQNRKTYFEHQARVTTDFVIPFIERSGPIPAGARVLEIGCGEAGVLKAFIDRGAIAVGVDLNGKRLARGRELLKREIEDGKLTLLEQNAHTLGEHPDLAGSFDLIVLKDVIEHVDDKPSLFDLMAKLLRPQGRVFLAFPPWTMPFGGHQQMCKSWLLSRTPYIHLLPTKAYASVLSLFSEPSHRLESLLANKRTGIGTAEFERMVSDVEYAILDQRLYLLNPMYSYRFGLRPVTQAARVAEQASVRDFVTTCAYYTVRPARSEGA